MTEIQKSKQKSAVKPLESLQQTAFTFRSPLRLEDCADALNRLTSLAQPGSWHGQAVRIMPINPNLARFTIERYRWNFQVGQSQQVLATAVGTLSGLEDGTTTVELALDWRRSRNWLIAALPLSFLGGLGLDYLIFSSPVFMTWFAPMTFSWLLYDTYRANRGILADITSAIDPSKQKVKKKPAHDKNRKR